MAQLWRNLGLTGWRANELTALVRRKRSFPWLQPALFQWPLCAKCGRSVKLIFSSKPGFGYDRLRLFADTGLSLFEV